MDHHGPPGSIGPPLSGTLVWWDDGQCLRIMAKSVVLTALPSPDLPAIGRPRPPTPPLCARRAAVALIGVPARGSPGLRSPVAPQIGWGGASLAQSAAPGLALCAQRLGRIRPGGGGIRHPTRPPPRQRPNVVYLGGDCAWLPVCGGPLTRTAHPEDGPGGHFDRNCCALRHCLRPAWPTAGPHSMLQTAPTTAPCVGWMPRRLGLCPACQTAAAHR